MIWGMILQPGQAYTEIIQDEVHLSMATMESRGCLGLKSDNYSHVMLKTSSAEYLLCTLVGGVTYQQSLDLKLMPNDNVTFSVQGTNVVYLTGYSYMPAEISADGGNQADDWIEEPSLNVSIPHGSDEMPGVDSQGADEISEMEPSYFPTVDREDPLQEREADESFSVEYTEDQSDYQQDANTEVETSLNTRNMKGPSTTTSDLDQTTQSAPDNNTVADVELLAVKEEIHTIVDTTEEDAPSQAEREAAATQPVNLPSTSTGHSGGSNMGSATPFLHYDTHPIQRATHTLGGGRGGYKQRDSKSQQKPFRTNFAPSVSISPMAYSSSSFLPSMTGTEMRNVKTMYHRTNRKVQRDVPMERNSELNFSVRATPGLRKRCLAQNHDLKCRFCRKTFALASITRRHERIHTGERPYECRLCLKTFRVQDSLKKHLRTHTGERPYTCDLCGKTFIQNSHLRVHQGKYHNRIPVRSRQVAM